MSGDDSNERKFLHDLASPIGTAMFLIDMLLDRVQNRPDVDAEEVSQVMEVCKALEKVKDLLQKRREILIKQGVPSARS